MEDDAQITYVEFFNIDIKAVARETKIITFLAALEKKSTVYSHAGNTDLVL